MRSKWLSLWAVVGLSLISACATAPTARKAPVTRASDGAPYDFKREGTVPPAKADESSSEVDIEEIAVTQESIEVSEAEPPPVDTTAVPAPADSIAEGFRVQIFASSDREIAENARVVAQQRLRLPGYLDLDSGVYKVRVGDFLTRADADRALPTVRREYADAWIVASKVAVPRAPTR